MNGGRLQLAKHKSRC